jgi:hypothetical protein
VCDDGRWLELSQDCVCCCTFMLTVLKLWVVVPESYLINEMGHWGNLSGKEVNESGSGLYPLWSRGITFCVLVPSSQFVK